MLLFDHMMNLDLQFHLMRKTGEISKICDRGTDATQASLYSRIIFGPHPDFCWLPLLCSCWAIITLQQIPQAEFNLKREE